MDVSADHQRGDRLNDTTANNEHNDGDWEYEYDENATEDVYVTLDLTSKVLQRPRKRKRDSENVPPPSRTPEAPQSIANNDNTAAASSSTPVEPLASNNAQPTLQQVVDPSLEQQNPTPGELRILDLLSENPIISHEGNIFSCSWAAALGTDLVFSVNPRPAPAPANDPTQSAPETTDPNANTDPHIDDDASPRPTPAAAGATTAPPPPPSFTTPGVLRQTPSYTLHAATALRLVATPVTIEPRSTSALVPAPRPAPIRGPHGFINIAPAPAPTPTPGWHPPPYLPNTTAAFQTAAQAQAEEEETAEAEAEAEEEEAPDRRTSAHTRRLRLAQTAFLSRLATAKRARGMRDAVPMYSRLPNHQPAGGRGGDGSAGGRNAARRARRWTGRMAAASGAAGAGTRADFDAVDAFDGAADVGVDDEEEGEGEGEGGHGEERGVEYDEDEDEDEDEEHDDENDDHDHGDDGRGERIEQRDDVDMSEVDVGTR